MSISFEDITCTMGRYTKAYFDCSKSSKIIDNAIFSNFQDQNPFPVLTEYVFKKTTVSFPIELFDYKERKGIRQGGNSISSSGRIVVLKRKNIGQNTNYFFIWISQSLLNKYLTQNDGKFEANIHVNFHPVGHINDIKEYPPYYDEVKAHKILNIDDPKDSFYKDNNYYWSNFFKLGVRYLFEEKQLVLQHRCSILRSDPNQVNLLNSQQDGIPIMIIVPVSGATPYFGDLGDASKFKEITKAVSDFCFELVQKERGSILPIMNFPAIGRIACSFYSRSGIIAEQLLSRSPDFIHEFYLYDVMLDKFHFVMDEKNKRKKVIDRTQEQGFRIVWSLLKQWRKDNFDKKIRIYSAYGQAVQPVAAEMRRSKHDENLGRFSAFNNKPDKAGGTYSNLSDGYEIYNDDKSVSLVYIPINNFYHYLDDIRSPGGFGVDDNYLKGDVGHSWFVRRLQTHSIFYSGFRR
jgi:hypothetical protein